MKDCIKAIKYLQENGCTHISCIDCPLHNSTKEEDNVLCNALNEM